MAQSYLYRSLACSLTTNRSHNSTPPCKSASWQAKKSNQDKLDLYSTPWVHRRWCRVEHHCWWRLVHVRPWIWPDRNKKKQLGISFRGEAWPAFFRLLILVPTFCLWKLCSVSSLLRLPLPVLSPFVFSSFSSIFSFGESSSTKTASAGLDEALGPELTNLKQKKQIQNGAS